MVPMTDLGALTAAGSDPLAATPQKATLGSFATTKDQFLKLLLAQMKNQDPLAPPDASKFTDQMTQFGQLEQLFNLNHTMEGISSLQSSSDRSQAVALIGKKVEALGDQVVVTAAGQDKATVGFKLDGAAKEVTLTLQDAQKNAIRTLKFYNQDAGSHSYSFDGKDDLGQALPEGVYTAVVSAATQDGSEVGASSLVSGTVTGVDFNKFGTTVQVAGRSLTMEQILSVKG